MGTDYEPYLDFKTILNTEQTLYGIIIEPEYIVPENGYLNV